MTLILRAEKGQETKTTNHEDMLNSTILNLWHIYYLFLLKTSGMAVRKPQFYSKVDPQCLFSLGLFLSIRSQKYDIKNIYISKKKNLCCLLF